MRMPAEKISNAASLSAEESELRAELVADVRVLGDEIGERNMVRHQQLIGAATFIEDSFSRAGLQPRRDSYELHGRACHNIETEIRGTRQENPSHRRALRFSSRLAWRERQRKRRRCNACAGAPVCRKADIEDAALRRLCERGAAVFSDRANGELCLREGVQNPRR